MEGILYNSLDNSGEANNSSMRYKMAFSVCWFCGFFSLLPDFEKEAEAFLRKYNCADAIETSRPIPIKDIATKLMFLDVIDTEYLSPDESVQGAITFTKGIVEVYDWSGQEYVGYEIDHPAIFIDTDIFNPGMYNNTLAHESFHWWKH